MGDGSSELKMVMQNAVDSPLVFDSSGLLRAQHRPAIGPDAYAVHLFQPVTEAVIDKYEQIHDISVPTKYRSLLTLFNGGEIFGLAIHGIPLSMVQEPPLLDRENPQPLDLATAEKRWKHGVTDSPVGLFIAARDDADENQIAYFWDNTSVTAIRSREVLQNWPTIVEFLRSEIPAAKTDYDAHEKWLLSLKGDGLI